MEDRKAVIGEETTYDEFVALLEGDESLAMLDFTIIKAVYDKVRLSFPSCPC